MAQPIYWTADQVPPAHIRTKAPNRIADGKGPAKAGGWTWGGTYHEQDLWHETAAGWWVTLEGVTPKDLLRVNAVPGFGVRGWLVPQVLRGEVCIIGHWTDQGFQVPDAVAPVVEALRSMLDETSFTTERHMRTAVAGLAINYHVTIHELGILEMLTHEAVREILMAMAGIPTALLTKAASEIMRRAGA